MHKIKVNRIVLSGLVFIVFLSMGLYPASAAINYGTTTYFSGAEEGAAPPVSEPILDPGGSVPNWRPGDTRKDNDPGDDGGGGIFDRITDIFDSIFGDGGTSPGTYQTVDRDEGVSLFDFQKVGSNDAYDNEDFGAYIMGPRGESLEGMSDEEAARYKSRLAQGFNFGNQRKEESPKKSRLLFTNVEVPFDLTTQYVLLGIVFFVAIGATVGYYLWKKETAKENMKYNRDEE